MRRVMLGHSSIQIAQDLGLSAHGVKIIVASPLFKLELRKMSFGREEKVWEVQETLLRAAVAGAKLHEQIISGEMSLPGGGKVVVPLSLSQASATATLNLFSKIHSREAKSEDVDPSYNPPYEKALREVIIRETITRTSEGGVSLPQLQSLEEEDEEGGEDGLPTEVDDLEDWEDDGSITPLEDESLPLEVREELKRLEGGSNGTHG